MGPPASDRVTRVRPYSGAASLSKDFAYGSFTLFAVPFQSTSAIRLHCAIGGPQPRIHSDPVWPLPRSLAATQGIDVSFSSSGYLDVSVHRVPFVHTILFIWRCHGIDHDVFPHSEICGSADMCSSPQLFAACHVLLRLLVPRHPRDALCHLTSDLSAARSSVSPGLMVSGDPLFLTLVNRSGFSRSKSLPANLFKKTCMFLYSISFRCFCFQHLDIQFSRYMDGRQAVCGGE